MAHYVDNDLFYREIVRYRDACRAAKLANKEKPQVPAGIGEALFKIATHMSRLPDFALYSFRDDLIADSVMIALRYLHNFNPDKGDKPFAYFSILIYRAFIRRIEIERKQSYIKNAMYVNTIALDSMYGAQNDTSGSTDPLRYREERDKDNDALVQVYERMQKFEDGLKKRKRHVKKR